MFLAPGAPTTFPAKPLSTEVLPVGKLDLFMAYYDLYL